MSRMRIDETLELLRSRIQDGASRNDLRLPTEVELAAELGVSRSTLREALALLEAEGVVKRTRSKGTYIRPTSVQREQEVLAYPVDLILSFTDYLSAHGVPFTVDEFSFRREPADGDPHLASDAEEVYRVRRVFNIREKPAAYLEHVVAVSYGGRDIDPSLLINGVTALFDRLETVQLESIDNAIGAEPADAEMANYLGLPKGSALVTMSSRLYGQNSDLLGTGRLVFRPDVLALSVRAVSRLNVHTR